jgi:hypothetical protein
MYLDGLSERLLDDRYQKAIFRGMPADAVADSGIKTLSKEEILDHYIAGPPYMISGKE